jgi:hypothetical protein
MIATAVRSQDGVWETEFAEMAVPFQVAFLVREHFGWNCKLTDIDMKVVGRLDRVFDSGVYGDVARFAKQPRKVELVVDVRL